VDDGVNSRDASRSCHSGATRRGPGAKFRVPFLTRVATTLVMYTPMLTIEVPSDGVALLVARALAEWAWSKSIFRTRID